MELFQIKMCMVYPPPPKKCYSANYNKMNYKRPRIQLQINMTISAYKYIIMRTDLGNFFHLCCRNSRCLHHRSMPHSHTSHFYTLYTLQDTSNVALKTITNKLPGRGVNAKKRKIK